MRESLVPEDIFYKLLNIAIKLKKEKGCFKVKDVQNYITLDRGKIRKRLATLTKQKILYNKGGEYSLRLNI
ncbi:MAG TPA: hypothetical protein ENG87_04450 [Candidatus Pacearchaeota archaeon]|nr:hypothetical protein [Candidatus Pacearchaeota archaeon]